MSSPCKPWRAGVWRDVGRVRMDQAVLDDLVRRIVETVSPVRVVLFGSAASRQMRADSDVDVLVEVPVGTHRLRTAQNLHRKMFGFPYPVDFVVATSDDLAEHGDDVGLIYRRALREGRLLYAS